MRTQREAREAEKRKETKKMVEDYTYKTRKIETTEWEDILLRKDIISEREEVTQQREADAEIANRSFVHFNHTKETTDEKLQRLMNTDDKKLEKELLNKIEDDVDSDERCLEKFRELRLEELKRMSKLEIYGDVYPLHREDFIKEVTEASKKPVDSGKVNDIGVGIEVNPTAEAHREEEGAIRDETEDAVSSLPNEGQWVIVELFRDGIQASNLLSEKMREVAKRQKSTKFVKIRSDECVENWPDRNVPTLFLYFGGKMQHQIVGLDEFGGSTNLTADRVEWILSKKYDLFASTVSSDQDPFEELEREKKINLNVSSSHVRWRQKEAEEAEEEEEEEEDDDGW